MKELLFVAAACLLLASCMTADKATGYLSAHRELAAGYCAAQFPVKENTDVTVSIDTAGWNVTVGELIAYGDSLATVAADRNDSLSRLGKLVNKLRNDGLIDRATNDVLQAQIAGIKPTDLKALRQSIETEVRRKVPPCKDSTIIKTVENTARYEEQRLRAERLQAEKDAMTDRRDWWRKACLITWAIVALYLAARFFASKLGFVGKFIK